VLVGNGENSMSAGSPFDAWRFLIGKWKGKAESQFGEKGMVESTVVFSLEPSDEFIMANGESRCEGRLLNKAVSLLFYDSAAGKFRRKSFFSYGFVNNEVEYARSSEEIRFDVEVEPLPKEFNRMRWRSYIKKLADNKIAMGLEVAKEGEAFKNYGESIYTKIS